MPTSPLDKLHLETLPTDSSGLYRVWDRPGSDWEPNPFSGLGRVDCPIRPREFEVLYLSTTPLTALQEARLLTERRGGAGWIFHRTRAASFKITFYRTTAQLTAVSLDPPNAALLGLDRVTLLDGKRPYQEASLRIRRERAADVPALFWRSRHREADGFVVAIFHDKKDEVRLIRVSTVLVLDHPIIEVLKRHETIIFD